MGGWEIFARNGGKPGMGEGVGFVMEGWKMFNVFVVFPS